MSTRSITSERYYKNLSAIYNMADEDHRNAGKLAYSCYNKVLQQVAARFSMSSEADFHRVVAAFVALSPNNDYYSNIRSLVSLLDGLRDGDELDDIVVSTYNACRDRAYKYLMGTEVFLKHCKGRKTKAFYQNILYPFSSSVVTVDGHMYWASRGCHGTMTEANITNTVYDEISEAVIHLANKNSIAPCQAQAVIWLTRKQLYQIKYEPPVSLFDREGTWCSLVDASNIQPYPKKYWKDIPEPNSEEDYPASSLPLLD